ncbi:MAG TPA: adenine phosphoribosyltransferase [Gemmatimonadota bacterium]|nr:adenine phosphoribosyltransferase [Gemmatimonadota bacterium]
MGAPRKGPGRDDELAERIRGRIVDHPDFPRPGIVFRDLTPVLRVPGLHRDITRRLAGEVGARDATAVAGIESRGFLFAAPVAHELGLPLIAIRKQGKLPGSTLVESYALEYGTAELELQEEAVGGNDRVFVVDDLLATGGTLEAACRLVERRGAGVAGLGVIVELDALEGRARLQDYNLLSLLIL